MSSNARQPTPPQATLIGIRAVVDACQRGATSLRTVAKTTRFSLRRASYALQAGALLGFVKPDGDAYYATDSGEALAATSRDSEAEAQAFADAIIRNELLKQLAPELLGPNPPSADEVTARLIAWGLSHSTAAHRARMILQWRGVLANRRIDFRKSKSSQRKTAMHTLEVRHFAQIEEARIEFGDLTVIVGPQATGKSLMLQWFKAALDAGEIVTALKAAGADVTTQTNLIDLIFGEGMSGGWTERSIVKFDERVVSPSSWTKGLRRKDRGTVFFVPAHRALLLSEGWPAPFAKLNADTPVVARLFSQNLYQRFSGRQAAALFPVSRILKEQYRARIDEAIFHGGQIELDKAGLRYRLRLTYKNADLPFMTWTAGQREFTPLLLGLYHVLPSRKETKLKDVDWVVVEEPEMGLHPQAISVFMLLVLDLLWRGYKVVISTHSPLVLDAVWAIQQLHKQNARWQLLSNAFGLGGGKTVQAVMEHALRATYRVFFMHHVKGGVRSQDISGLDPSSLENAEAEWGGLTEFSSRFAEAVRRGANEADAK